MARIKQHIVSFIKPDSVAEELGIQKGDQLLSIDDEPVLDVLDYHYKTSAPQMIMEFLSNDGYRDYYEIEMDDDESLGIVFESALMDQTKNCSNQCIFCTADTLPASVKKSFSAKKDDWRLSFLKRHYVTLTNLDKEELSRIVEQRISPLYISVHATDTEIRKKMLQNEKAGNILLLLQRFASVGICFHTQIVLCKGINDKEILSKTIKDLAALYPKCQSLSVVPAGICKNEQTPFAFDKQSSIEVIDQIESYAAEFQKKHNDHFVYAADEFYNIAEKALPQVSYYRNIQQLENGVGQMPLFLYEAQKALEKAPITLQEKKATIVTYHAAFPFIKEIATQIAKKSALQLDVITCPHHCLCGNISSTGLFSGQDIFKLLKDKPLADVVFIPQTALLEDTNTFIDEMTLQQLSDKLSTHILPLKSSGEMFVKILTDPTQWRC